MSERGVFAVDRGVFDHPLFASKEPFSRREAWLWLLAEAEWKPAKRRLSGQMVTLERGQLAHSVRFMAEAWGWSKSAVDRFLGRLKTETMIGTDSGTGVLVITICKYEDYQKVALPKRDTKDAAGGTAAGQQRDRLESSESSEKKPSVSSAPTPVEELSRVLDPERAKAVVEHRQRIRKPITAYGAKKLAEKLALWRDPAEAADAMIANGWQGFEPAWMERRGEGVRAHPPPERPDPGLVTLAPDHPDFKAMERMKGRPIPVGTRGVVTFRKDEIEKARSMGETLL